MAEKCWPQSGGHHKLSGLYELKKTLGRGHFAVVRLAQHVFTGENVAIKVIDKTKLDKTSMDHLYHEVTCMKLVQHPNVVRLYEVIETSTKLYLILELGDGGDMYDYIMRHDQGLDEEQAKEYFAQILCAISYCHKMHVVHRDLKPENVVFFESQGLVKLTDFGFSNLYDPGKKLSTSCGSLAYSAPEILLGEEYDAPAVDVWSLGVILYMLVCGEAPFNEANDSETLTNIMDCKYTVLDHVDKDCGDLIKSMIIREPSERIKLEDIKSHRWLEDCETLKDDVFESTPLLTRDLISEDLHLYIVEQMVEGKLAEHEEIEQAINEDKYNHITSTYFLLAHRSLEAQNMLDMKSNMDISSRDIKAMPINIQPVSMGNNILLPQYAENLPTPKPVYAAHASLPPCQTMLVPIIQTGLHSSALSTLSEGDVNEESSPASSNSSLYFPGHSHHYKGDKKMSPPFPREHLIITPRHGFSVAKGGIDTLIEEEERSRSQTTTDDEDEDITCARIINPVQLASHLQRASLQMKRLKKRKSAPVLNEICEENETETADLGNISEDFPLKQDKHIHRRRHTTSEKPRSFAETNNDTEMLDSEVFDAVSEDVVPELYMDTGSTFTSRTGRGNRRGSHKSSGSETSDDDSESRRASRSNLHAAVLGGLNRRRRDSSGDRDGSGSGGRGKPFGARRNSGPASLSSNENTGSQMSESEKTTNQNASGNGETQENDKEEINGPDNNNFNNSTHADFTQERTTFSKCITPNILMPLNATDNSPGENILNNFHGRRTAKPLHFNHICNIPEKRSKSAESNQSNYTSSQTSSARSSSSSLNVGYRCGRIMARRRAAKNCRSTMSDTGLVLRMNNLRYKGIPNSSSSSSSIGSLSITVPSNTSSRFHCNSPCSLHRPHSEGNVTEEKFRVGSFRLKHRNRQCRSTSLPRPCCYVHNNLLKSTRAASCGPYISHGQSRKRQCMPALSAPGVTIQPCIPESRMATIESVGQLLYASTEMKDSNIKRSNISLASSTCSASKYAVDPVNELILSPMDEVEESLSGSLSRHGKNMKFFKHTKRHSSTTSADSLHDFKYIDENGAPTPTKMGRVKMTFFPHISADNIFRRKGGTKTSPTGSTSSKKWFDHTSNSHTKFKTIPGNHPYGMIAPDGFLNDSSLVVRKTKPDCCVIM